MKDCLQPREIILLMLQTDLFCWRMSCKGGEVEEISFKSWSPQIWRGDARWDIWELDSQDGNDDKQDNFENAAKEGLGGESSILTAMVRQSQPLHFSLPAFPDPPSSFELGEFLSSTTLSIHCRHKRCHHRVQVQVWLSNYIVRVQTPVHLGPCLEPRLRRCVYKLNQTCGEVHFGNPANPSMAWEEAGTM